MSDPSGDRERVRRLKASAWAWRNEPARAPWIQPAAPELEFKRRKLAWLKATHRAEEDERTELKNDDAP